MSGAPTEARLERGFSLRSPFANSSLEFFFLKPGLRVEKEGGRESRSSSRYLALTRCLNCSEKEKLPPREAAPAADGVEAKKWIDLNKKKVEKEWKDIR